MDGATGAGDRFTRLFYACQFFYGGWFLFHGLNWWLHYFPERSFAPSAHGLIPELIRTGLFDLVKSFEIAVGLALLGDLFVPLAIVVAFPITVVIAWVNASKSNVFGLSVAAIIVSLNALMAIGHLDRYLPMLVRRAGPPGGHGLRAWHSGSIRREVPVRLPACRHVLAIALGVAIPAAITYASIDFASPPRAALVAAQ